MTYEVKVDLIDFFSFINLFNNKYGMPPNNAIVANHFKIDVSTVKRNLTKLKELGKIEYKDTGKYNTRYKIINTKKYE
jgi:DNA-binding IclR family transcriptional regulator